jgi:hypothetical protein
MPRKTASKSRKIRKTRKKGFSWKKSQKKHAFKSQAKKVAVTSLLFLFSLCFLSFYTLLKFASSPFASASDAGSVSSFNSEDVFTVLFISTDSLEASPIRTEAMSLVFLDQKSSQVYVFDIDTEMEIDVAGKFGMERLSKILALSSMEESGINPDLALRTIEDLFAHKIDRYVVVGSDLHTQMSGFWNDGVCKDVLKFDTLKLMNSSLKTDMSFSEYYDIYRFYKSLPAGNLVKYGTSNLDVHVREINIESRVALERKSVAVLNGTDLPGLASFGARVVENLGARVVSVGNADTNYESSMLVGDFPDSLTAQKIMDFFDIDETLPKESALFIEDSEVTRADITLIFGVDIFQ